MKQKLTALLLALSMMMALAACGTKKEDAPAVSTPAASSTVESVETPGASVEEPASSEETPADPDSDGPSEPVVEEPADEKQDSPAREEEKNTTEKPAVEVVRPVTPTQPTQPEAPAQPETPVQPETPAAESVDLNAFYETLAANGGENWPMMGAMSDAETLDAFYAGLTAISTKQATMYMPMMSSVAVEFMLVEVENEADVQAVKDILQARIDYQVGDGVNPGGAWYPESIEGWKTNSRIVSNGRYVMLAVYPENVDGIVEQFNALF